MKKKQQNFFDKVLDRLPAYSATRVIASGFLAVILLGALLLMLPFATEAGEQTSFLTALFTSTTSICVTGLVVVDTFSHWTLFGKIIILLLIQIGGFGVVTMYALVMMAFNRKFSFHTRMLIQEYYNMNTIQGLVKFMIKVVKGTLIVEGIGAILYMFVFIPKFGALKGAWASVFNSISAFCNAGIDILGPDSLCQYSTNIPINLITMALIVLGGLGYIVWFDFMDNVRKTRAKNLQWKDLFRRMNEHSKLVICLTSVLIVSGAVLVFAFEYNNPQTIGNMSFGNKVMASFFQSITFRTAGFATVPQDGLSTNTTLIGLVYMFIGGSPVGTAGGVKTVTMFILLLNTVSFVRDRDEAVVFNRKISQKMINKATAVITVSLTLTLIFAVALIQTNDVSPMAALYEIFSATATVGLSQSVTPSLNAIGRVIVIIAMYAGRIGPISMTIFFNAGKSTKNRISYAQGKFFVG